MHVHSSHYDNGGDAVATATVWHVHLCARPVQGEEACVMCGVGENGCRGDKILTFIRTAVNCAAAFCIRERSKLPSAV